jgi:hypothetical protein
LKVLEVVEEVQPQEVEVVQPQEWVVLLHPYRLVVLREMLEGVL